MNNSIFFSKYTFCLIITTKNRKELLNRCIKSVINQSEQLDKNDIIIIINDGGEENVINLWPNLDCKVIIKNYIDSVGPAKRKNEGLDLCTQDYIFFCDDDDMFEHNYISEIKNEIYNNPNKILYHSDPIVCGDNFIGREANGLLIPCPINITPIGGTFVLNNKKVKENGLKFPEVQYSNDKKFYDLIKKLGKDNIFKMNFKGYVYDRISIDNQITKKILIDKIS